VVFIVSRNIKTLLINFTESTPMRRWVPPPRRVLPKCWRRRPSAWSC